MSESKKQLSEFEQLLESVTPTEAQGNPMQIMYLAGQQSKSDPVVSPKSNQLWQVATLVSSTVAACLLVTLFIPSTSELKPNSVASNVSEPLKLPVADDRSAVEKVPSLRLRQTNAFEIAQSRMPKSSIDMFGDFELEPIDSDRFKKEYFE